MHWWKHICKYGYLSFLCAFQKIRVNIALRESLRSNYRHMNMSESVVSTGMFLHLMFIFTVFCFHGTNAAIQMINPGPVRNLTLECLREPQGLRSAVDLAIECTHDDACRAVLWRQGTIDIGDRCFCPEVPYNAGVVPQEAGSLLYIYQPDMSIPGIYHWQQKNMQANGVNEITLLTTCYFYLFMSEKVLLTSDAYASVNEPTLVQRMVRRLVGGKPLSQPILQCC